MSSEGALTSRLQSVIDRLADEVGRAVVINDCDLRPLAASAQGEPLDEGRIQSILQRRTPEPIVRHLRALGVMSAEEPFVVDGEPELGFLRRLCVPLRHEQNLFGFLWMIIDDHELSAEDQRFLELAADDARAAFLAERTPESEPDLGWRVLQGLLDADPGGRDSAVEKYEEAWGAEGRGAFRLGYVRLDVPTADETASISLARSVSRLGSERDLVYMPSRDELLVVHSGSSASWTPETAGMKGAVGVSAEFSDLWVVRSALRSARFAALLSALEPSVSSPAHVDRLGAWLLLRDVPWIADSVRQISPAAAVLLEPGHEALCQTALALLDNGGDVAATVAALHIHRATFYHRLERIRGLVGGVLSDGWQRVGLHVALRLHGLLSASAYGAADHQSFV